MANEFDQIMNPNLTKSMADINQALQLMALNMGKVFSETDKLKKEFDNTAKSAKTTSEKTTEYSKILDQTAINEKKLTDIKLKLEQTEKGLNDEIVRTTLKLREATKAQQDRLKIEGLAETSLVKMKMRLADLTTAYDKSAVRTKEQEKNIQSLTKEIQKAEDSTGRHTRKVGDYAGQLSFLRGPMNTASQGFKMLGISEGIALWPIALIVGALVGLYKIFVQTASGARFMKEIFAEIGAIVDVLKQRVMMLIDGFKNFSWDKIKAAFKGVGDQMSEAAKAAKELADAQLDLNRLTAFHISEEADEINKIQELLFLAKDRTKSDSERLAYMQEAIKLSREQADTEVKFAKQQYEIDVANAARKTSITGITQDQIRTFIKMGYEEQEQARKTSKVYAEFFDKIGGKDGVEKLESAYAKMVDADTEFFSSNKRNESLMTGFLDEQREERNKINEKAIEDKKKLAEAEAEYIKNQAQQEFDIQVLLIQATATSKEDAENKIFELKKQSLKKTLDLLQIELDAFKGTALEKIALQEKLSKAKYDLEKVGLEETIKVNERAAEDRKKATEAALEWDKEQDKIEEDKKKKDEDDQKKADENKKKADEKKKQDLEDIQNQSINIANELFDFQSAIYDADLQKLEEKNEKGLLSDKEFAKQKAEIELKQAKTARIQALFNIAVDTATAVQKLWGQTGALAPILIGLAIASGIIQAGIVLSQPLPTVPAFFKGGTAEKGFGTFGERGFEYMLTKQNEIFKADKTTFFAGDKFKGAHIFTNEQSREMESRSRHSGFGSQSFSDVQIVNKLDSIEKTIRDKPVVIVDKESRKPIGYEQNGSVITYLNRIRN